MELKYHLMYLDLVLTKAVTRLIYHRCNIDVFAQALVISFSSFYHRINVFNHE